MTARDLREVVNRANAFNRERHYRDKAIRAAYEAGHSLREIAALAGLTHAGVKKIIDRG